MYHVMVKEIKRGFWGPKHTEVMNFFTESYDEAIRAAQPYEHSNWHLINLKNMNEFLGGNDGIPPVE